MQVLDRQVKTFGLHSENDQEEWEVFYRELEGQGQCVKMINLVEMCTSS